MSVTYRAVKDNDSAVVLAIGYDQEQGGEDYNGIGTWCTWTFDTIPEVDSETQTWADDNNYGGSLLKISGESVVSRTVADLEEEVYSSSSGE